MDVSSFFNATETRPSPCRTLVVSEDYGYVILVAVLSMLFAYSLGAVVFFARKIFDVPYPAMYSETSMQFNCLQRIHGNYLEMFPTFLALLFCGGLSRPLLSAAGGLVYLAGKFVYSIGYGRGDPQKRLFGLFYYIGLLILLFTTVECALKLINWL